MKKRVGKEIYIGVIGTISSGKGTVAHYISQKYGLKHIIMSDFLRKVLRKRGIAINRESLRHWQSYIRRKYCKGNLSICTLEDIQKQNLKRVVIDGIRRPKQAKLLKKKLNIKIIFVDAPLEIRFRRAKLRQRRGYVRTFEEFKKQDKKEIKIFKMNKTKKYADFKIINDKGKKDTYKKVDKVMKRILV